MEERTRTLRSDALLLLAAAIWGFAFVAQRAGMWYIGPFTFNGIRFALGAVTLIPFVRIDKNSCRLYEKRIFSPGILAGLAIFAGVSFQQIGLLYTTAGKAGFITGLYVIIVPIIGIFLGKRTGIGVWLGAILAIIGMYFLSIKSNFTMDRGDFLVFIGAFFWAIHVHLIGHFAPKVSPIKLAFLQFSTVSILSLSVASISEKILLSNIVKAWLPLIYAGVFSAGIAYTVQVIAQREAHPSHAAIILSLEAVFAVLGGWLILQETLNLKEGLGCVLMLSGMIVSQIYLASSERKRKSSNEQK
ncbi:MAG: DMT family transporter [Candidatus Aminicenantes bacterium]|nr:DMT family transporter [Candidatus Aminicenantes bacterium]